MLMLYYFFFLVNSFKYSNIKYKSLENLFLSVKIIIVNNNMSNDAFIEIYVH